jgi:uncharacterized protein (DUF302 family)
LTGAVGGLITQTSGHGPAETLERLRQEIGARSLTIFAEIDHAAGAAAAGLTLRPLFLVIFGAAKSGTPLMQAAATAGIDLPLKILVWQDEAGATHVSYNDPVWLAHRHGLGAEVGAPVHAMSTMLSAIVAAAAS